MTDSTERELRTVVELAVARDADAWASLYRRAYPGLFAYARRRLRSEHEADDAVSETMLRALNQIDTFTSKGAGFDAWLYSIARNVIREGPAGSVEFEAALRSPAGDAAADVVGIKTGIGRIVRLRSESLRILPTGDYYEIWFVGPEDTPAQLNRISAGTFHPDEQGRSEVELTAAVDPAKYNELSVTAEPGDGNPSPNGPEVLRTRLQVRA